jgi:hypothetical protein
MASVERRTDSAACLSRARQELARHAAAVTRTNPHLSRRELRRKFRAAGFGASVALVFHQLTVIAGPANGFARVTWNELAARCYGMANETLRRSLEHLERHGWITRSPGRPTRYELHEGDQCQCKPGRGNAMTPAERQRKSRSERKTRAADVTETGSKDVTQNVCIEPN